MSTVVVGDQPWVTEALEERRALGQDLYDEQWEGVYDAAPNATNEHAQVCLEVSSALQSRARRLGLVGSGPFNLGTGPDPPTGKKNFRVPDGGWFRKRERGTSATTALVVLEVLSSSRWSVMTMPAAVHRSVLEVERRRRRVRPVTGRERERTQWDLLGPGHALRAVQGRG